MILVIIIVKLIGLGILHYRIMGDVGIEHRVVFIGGFGLSYISYHDLHIAVL